MKKRPPLLPLVCVATALLGFAGAPSAARAQTPGSLDPTFSTDNTPDFEVRAVAVQPDGKIVLGGRFGLIGATARNGLARLNADGSVDTTFDPGTGIDFGESSSGVYSLAIQPDGKILAGGIFGTYNGATHANLVRVNADGSADAAFTAGTGPSQDIRTIVLQGDGKILLGGGIEQVNGTPRLCVARLNADGTLDTTFDPKGKVGTAGQFVAGLALQPDGKIVAVGRFTVVQNNVIRLNADGSVDNSFDPGNGANTTVFAVVRQSDGKLVMGGQFNLFDNKFKYSLVRLNANGSLDANYAADLGTQDFQTFTLALQADGKLLIGGRIANEGIPGLARLNTDGTRDTTYQNGTGVGGITYALAVQPDNQLILGGNFGSYDGTDITNIARINGGPAAPAHPAFFGGEVALGGGAYFLQFASGNPFGYYSYLADPAYIYHFDLGYEYVFDAADGKSGVYFYDFASNTFFYTSPAFPFPYLYDFTLNTVLYYFPNPNDPQHYNTDGVRYFVRLDTGAIFSK